MPASIFLTFTKRISGNNFSDMIYILEETNIEQAQIKSQEYMKYYGNEAGKRLNSIDIVFNFNIVIFFPVIYKYIISNSALMLVVLILFTINYLLSFILQNIGKHLLYMHIKKYYRAEESSSFLPVKQIAYDI